MLNALVEFPIIFTLVKLPKYVKPKSRPSLLSVFGKTSAKLTQFIAHWKTCASGIVEDPARRGSETKGYAVILRWRIQDSEVRIRFSPIAQPIL